MKASGHFVSALADGEVYRLGTDDAYPYDAKDRNGYRRSIASGVKACGASCGKGKVPAAMKRWAARVQAGKEDEVEEDEREE